MKRGRDEHDETLERQCIFETGLQTFNGTNFDIGEILQRPRKVLYVVFMS